VAASGVDAHEGITRGAKFRARLIVAAATAEKSARGVSPTIEPLLPLIGNGQSASLRAVEGVPIIPELVRALRRCDAGGFQGWYLPTPESQGLRKNIMDKFEEIGQKLDAELTRLRKFVENDLAPETEKRTATFLREVSEKLTEAAGWLEARRTGRTSPDEKKPAA
jgi:hypothetical protein